MLSQPGIPAGRAPRLGGLPGDRRGVGRPLALTGIHTHRLFSVVLHAARLPTGGGRERESRDSRRDYALRAASQRPPPRRARRFG